MGKLFIHGFIDMLHDCFWVLFKKILDEFNVPSKTDLFDSEVRKLL
jgi:hypothetical protein